MTVGGFGVCWKALSSSSVFSDFFVCLRFYYLVALFLNNTSCIEIYLVVEQGLKGARASVVASPGI